ncbi:MAG: hypothetical protein R3230_01410 [Nitrosopumilaceae archaeon]|nr:hypothetical protein [Nitrosopumilaceae archaeon]
MQENEKDLQQEIVEEIPQDTVVEGIIPEDNVQSEVAQARPDGTQEEKNLARLRELRKIAEKERDDALRAQQELQQQLQSYQQQYSGNYQQRNVFPQQQQTQSPPTYEHLNPDDLVEGRHLSKYDQEMKQIKQTLAQQKAVVEIQNQMNHLRTKYADFDKVVSEDNVKLLHAKYPAIAQSLASAPDLNSLGESAYEIIKRFGIHQDDSFEPEKQKAQLNATKPRPMGSSSPLAQASQYDRAWTAEQLERDRLEMEEAIRNNR